MDSSSSEEHPASPECNDPTIKHHRPLLTTCCGHCAGAPEKTQGHQSPPQAELRGRGKVGSLVESGRKREGSHNMRLARLKGLDSSPARPALLGAHRCNLFPQTSRDELRRRSDQIILMVPWGEGADQLGAPGEAEEAENKKWKGKYREKQKER